jgi:hypothetical protein
MPASVTALETRFDFTVEQEAKTSNSNIRASRMTARYTRENTLFRSKVILFVVFFLTGAAEKPKRWVISDRSGISQLQLTWANERHGRKVDNG